MTPTIQYPTDLPCVLFEGRSHQTVEPTVRTQLASGRARVRRAFTAVPVTQDVRWIMNGTQAAQFESWFKNDLKDGAEWFSMEMLLPQGRGPWAFRFNGVYAGPVRIGPDLWSISAQLEQWLRA